jgi:hypothetical protein
MGKPRDGKFPILPSKTRRGMTLNTSVALDSPSVMSKLLTPLHDLDIQFPIERLDLNSMIQHKFVSFQAWLGNLSYEITFLRKSAWRVVKTDRSVHLPAPLLFNLDGMNGWSLTEDELDTYMDEHPQHVHGDGEETEDNSVQPSSTWEFPYQQSYLD